MSNVMKYDCLHLWAEVVTGIFFTIVPGSYFFPLLTVVFITNNDFAYSVIHN